MIQRLQLPLLAAVLGTAVLLPAVPAAAADAVAITISHSQKTVDFLPLWIASDAGYFKAHGINATVTYLPAQEGMPALLTGQVQIAGNGASDAASAEAQGAKLKAVLTLTPIYTFQFWARPDHASASALKGQRVGITSTTGSLYVATLLALKELGLKPSDVMLTSLGGVVNVNSSLMAGSVAAAASHPPATYQFKRAGMVDLVDLAKDKIPSVSAGLWVTQSYLDGHRDVVANVVDAVVEALHREKSDRAYAESEIKKHLGITDKDELDFTYDYYVNELLAPEPMPDVAQIKGDVDALVASNPKVKTIDMAGMIDRSFVEQAVKRQAAQ
jgi:NitT/TauT family transport system substrate-binding protein